jgi:flagellar hook-length control protein FliK
MSVTERRPDLSMTTDPTLPPAAEPASNLASPPAPTTATTTAATTATAVGTVTAAPTPALHSVAYAPPIPANTAPIAVPVPISGLAVEIAARAQTGKNHFEIRLDPPELGHIDVRLDVDRDGNVSSRLVVERPETLDLLRRDAPNLERAFHQAGLKTSDNSLQFSLRDQAFSGRDNGGQSPAMARLIVADENTTPIEVQNHYGRLAGLGGGVDIRV